MKSMPNQVYSHTSPEPVTLRLRDLLEEHSDKRVLVLGTTCAGKSTMLSAIPGARDQDKEVFLKLTKEQSEYVCQEPWTEDIGRAMTGVVLDAKNMQAQLEREVACCGTPFLEYFVG